MVLLMRRLQPDLCTLAIDDSSSSSDGDVDDNRNPSADTPASFICPISHMIFKDPVTAADDNT